MIDLLWHTKLAAWIHDPAEKALVLLRDPAGHEGGTAKALRQRISNPTACPMDYANTSSKPTTGPPPPTARNGRKTASGSPPGRKSGSTKSRR